ncbi:uncharacterized protein LOC131948328 [Physella acuta]|uniref:uncharacterized protein LOC131948328 n=1 Tax=Physella acuta TaxID=109671 RepID=UPI0027DAE47C|nr:uncharacterized protein LOC131948328 [Physella acuta]
MEAAHPFDFIAMTSDKIANYDSVRAVPQSYWLKSYGVMMRVPSKYEWAVLLSLVDQAIRIQYYGSIGTKSENYCIVSSTNNFEQHDVKSFQPYTYQGFRHADSRMLTQVVYFDGTAAFGLLVASEYSRKQFAVDMMFVPPARTKYTFYGLNIMRKGAPFSFTYYILATSVPKLTDTMTVDFKDGTHAIISTPIRGYIYEFINMAKLDSTFKIEVYAIDYTKSEYFQLESVQNFKPAHVILNPYHKDITEINVTVTGSREALADLHLNGQPLALPNVVPLFLADNIYTGEVRIAAEPVKITSSKNITIFIQGGDTHDLMYSLSSFGLSELLDPEIFDINIRESFEDATEAPTPAGETPVTTEKTTRPISQPTKASTVVGYNEFNIICGTKFYGSDCTEQCTCTSHCRIDGTCTNTQCKIGFFGEGCKLEDLTIHAVELSPPVLFDADKNTGEVLSDVKVALKLIHPSSTNSFTIAFEDGSDLSKISKDKFDIQVWDENLKAMVALTEDYTVVINNDNTLTVSWEKPRVVNKMEVTIATDQKATSFHLSGGIQVESTSDDKQKPGDPKTPLFSLQVGHPTPFPKLAADLTDNDRSATCVQTDEAKDMFMNFASYTFLQRILLFTPGNSKEWKAQVLCYNNAGVEVLKTEVASAEKTRIHQVNINKNVLKVTIKIVSGSIYFCEVQAYADPNGPLKEDTQSKAIAEEASSSSLIYILLLLLLFACCIICTIFALLRKHEKHPPISQEEK